MGGIIWRYLIYMDYTGTMTMVCVQGMGTGYVSTGYVSTGYVSTGYVSTGYVIWVMNEGSGRRFWCGCLMGTVCG